MTNTNKVEAITFGRTVAAQKLGISIATLDRQIARRRISFFRVGRRVLFTQQHLEKYVDENTYRIVRCPIRKTMAFDR